MHAGPEADPANVMSPQASRQTARQALRRALIAQREALPPQTVTAWSRAICEHLQQEFPRLAQQRVAFCWPIRNEADLRPLIERWLRDGDSDFVPLLPVVTAPGAALAFRRWLPEAPLTLDRHGIPTPSAGEFVIPDALLIPVNAFDAHGYRLGYGGGYFDRTLAAANPRPLAIGIGFAQAQVDSVEPEEHDMRLDVIVTEQGIVKPLPADPRDTQSKPGDRIGISDNR